MVELLTSDPSETRSLGRMIGPSLPIPSVVGIDGPLGSGKTCLAQGIAEGVGVHSDTHVTSPAYTLVQEYSLDDFSLVHIDFYRLHALTLNDYVLFEELFENTGHIIVVEWASKFLHDLVSGFLQVSISKSTHSKQRLLNFFSDSGLYFPLIKELQDYANSGA